MAWRWDDIDWTTTAVVTAAWVQAVGSVAAILFATGIANQQSRAAFEREARDREAAAAERRAAIRAHRQTASTLALKAGDALLDYIQRLGEMPTNRLMFSEMALSDLVSAGRDLDQLPIAALQHDQAIAYFMTIRGEMASAIAFARGCASWSAEAPVDVPKAIEGLNLIWQQITRAGKSLNAIVDA